ncbi:MAG: hypothetical protein AAF974_04585 [Cyanobacteria bacterium P01_E01_bin.34]
MHTEVYARLSQSLYTRLFKAQLGNQPSPISNDYDAATSRPWTYRISRVVPPSTSTFQAFGDPLSGTAIQPLASSQGPLALPQQPLLILGEPGSGKTTTLLDLAARQLSQLQISQIDRELNTICPATAIPVLLDLSTWTHRRQPIPRWLAEELVAKYEISPIVAHRWIQEGRIWPLLDGLDRVERIFQAACIRALNQWLQQSFSSQTQTGGRGGRASAQTTAVLAPAIACRTAAYSGVSQQLNVTAVAMIERLSDQQVSSTLHSLGSSHLTPYLQSKSAPNESLHSPAFLCMVAAIDRHSPSTIARVFTPQRTDAYLVKMYVRSSMNRLWRYPPSLVLRLLAWVARQMTATAKPEFEVNALHPLTSLQHPALLGQYGVGVSVTFGLVGGVVGAIGGGLPGSVAAAVAYAVLGAGNALVLNADCSHSYWRLSKRFGWRQLASVVLLYSPIAFLAAVCVGAFGTGLRLGLGLMLAGITWFGLSGWLVGDLGGQLADTDCDERGWVGGGLGRSIRRGWLRFLLWRSGSTPWNYQQFLDDCVEADLLQKVGDRYRFIHPTIQDYFTTTKY